MTTVKVGDEVAVRWAAWRTVKHVSRGTVVAVADEQFDPVTNPDVDVADPSTTALVAVSSGWCAGRTVSVSTAAVVDGGDVTDDLVEASETAFAQADARQAAVARLTATCAPLAFSSEVEARESRLVVTDPTVELAATLVAYQLTSGAGVDVTTDYPQRWRAKGLLPQLDTTTIERLADAVDRIDVARVPSQRAT